MRPTAQRCLPWPGNTLPGPWRISRRQRCNTLGFTSNARATSPTELPRSSRCTAASLNSFVNILFDNPMTHSPFQWILSLNWLCQKWGQVQFTSNARATSPTELPRSSRCTAASLNSFVNILFDNPMTHSPFQWILSLNWLCQKWGQVHCIPSIRSALEHPALCPHSPNESTSSPRDNSVVGHSLRRSSTF